MLQLVGSISKKKETGSYPSWHTEIGNDVIELKVKGVLAEVGMKSDDTAGLTEKAISYMNDVGYSIHSTLSSVTDS